MNGLIALSVSGAYLPVMPGTDRGLRANCNISKFRISLQLETP